MKNNARLFFIATITLVFIAFAPLLISTYAYYKIGIAGCVAPQYEPEPSVYCPKAIPLREALTEQEAELTRLLDYGYFFILTFSFAGISAIMTGLFTVYFGVKELQRKKK